MVILHPKGPVLLVTSKEEGLAVDQVDILFAACCLTHPQSPWCGVGVGEEGFLAGDGSFVLPLESK